METPKVEQPEETPDFESMTIAELKAYASEKGIELTATKKADIIAELKAN